MNHVDLFVCNALYCPTLQQKNKKSFDARIFNVKTQQPVFLPRDEADIRWASKYTSTLPLANAPLSNTQPLLLHPRCFRDRENQVGSLTFGALESFCYQNQWDCPDCHLKEWPDSFLEQNLYILNLHMNEAGIMAPSWLSTYYNFDIIEKYPTLYFSPQTSAWLLLVK